VIEIIEDISNDLFIVSHNNFETYEYSSLEDAVSKARELCDCNDEFEVTPFFNDEL
jgi:hypothetical protein